ncbi:MAG: hypothetical protein HY208_00490 [Nitrospirae bacterium]|nr:hypothetical protein [Nitrospirota bacterium]
MKRTMIWGMGLALAAALLWWGFQGTGQASHNPSVGYSHNNYIGGPSDSTSDGDGSGSSSDRTGFDRNADRVPDGDSAGSADDRGGTDGDGTGAGVPDCVNGPGDGTGVDFSCGNDLFSSDNVKDYNGAGDGYADQVRDDLPASGFNRAGDDMTDAVPEHTNSDRYRLSNGLTSTQGDRVGNRDCIAADKAVGECDRNTNMVSDWQRDRVGRDGNTTSADWNTLTAGDGTPDQAAADIAAGFDDPGRPSRDGDSNGSDGSGTPDRIARANADSTPDASQDRDVAGTLRDAGDVNHSSASRDAYATGPGDSTHDSGFGGGSDQGGFGYGGVPSGGGSGGCSLVASASATTGSGFAYLLVLFAPVAVVLLRRLGRRSR